MAMSRTQMILSVLVVPFVARWAYKRALTLAAIDPKNIGARLTAPLLCTYSFEGDAFYSADGAPASVVAQRKAGMTRLMGALAPGAKSAEAEATMEGLSDLRFTDTNRVPFAFQKEMRSKLRVSSIVAQSNGPVLSDIDGKDALDVSGSYGVNVVGYEGYKGFVERGWARVKDLGPNVLGPLHPEVAGVIARLRAISGLDEVSFHMSGTEAVMCAVRMARFNTRRKLIVTFAGAYHGWWDGVQPGAGNERFTSDVLALKDMSPASLRVIEARASEIAAVLVSPLQGLNPGSPPPSDMVLLDAKVRSTNDKIADYTAWLHKLRALTTKVGVPLMFDEVYTGFRMARNGAQEFYGVQADYVVYGKTLGGGLPLGVVCGRRELMRRFDSSHPLRVAYVIGTFSAAPITVGTVAEFLDWHAQPSTAQLYPAMTARTDAWVMETNRALASLTPAVPLRVDSLTTVWTVLFKQPGRYHWMYQYYLRAEGLALSWVGTGRCLFSLDFTPEQYAQTQRALIAAAEKMRDDGWWWDGSAEGEEPLTSKAISSMVAKELVGGMVASWTKGLRNDQNATGKDSFSSLRTMFVSADKGL